jgi:hypothetical protein
MTTEEAAWAAGIFEGEGTIRTRSDGYYGGQLSVRMNDRDVVERLYRMAGCGHFYTGECNGKPQYTWQVAKAREICEFLIAILPWLGKRRKARAIAAIESCKAMPRIGSALADLVIP